MTCFKIRFYLIARPLEKRFTFFLELTPSNKPNNYQKLFISFNVIFITV